MAPAEDTSPAATPSARVRKVLERLVRTDADFDALCLNYFPQASRRFAGGMERMQKENLLLSLVEPVAVAQALRTQYGDTFKQHEHLLGRIELDATNSAELHPHLLIEVAPDPSQCERSMYYVSATLAWQGWSGEYTYEPLLTREDPILVVDEDSGSPPVELMQPILRADLEKALQHIHSLVAPNFRLMIEVFVPRQLLAEGFEGYRKVSTPTRIGCEHPVVLRSLERLEVAKKAANIEQLLSSKRHREIILARQAAIRLNLPLDEFGRRKERWDELRRLKQRQALFAVSEPSVATPTPSSCAILPNHEISDENPRESTWAALNPPKEAGTSQLVSALLRKAPVEQPARSDLFQLLLQAGIPIMCWLRAGAESTHSDLCRAICDQEIGLLPEQIQKQRHAAVANAQADHIGNRIVLLWDNPYRQPLPVSMRSPRRD